MTMLLGWDFRLRALTRTGRDCQYRCRNYFLTLFFFPVDASRKNQDREGLISVASHE